MIRLARAQRLGIVAALAFSAALVLPRAAHAQSTAPSAEAKAAAEAAFDEGKRLMSAKDYAAACPKLEASLRDAPGLGTMLGLADCYEKNGQTASSWAMFREAAAVAASRKDGREPLARENAARLTPLLSRLVVRVPAGAVVPELHVTRDGVEIGTALWGAEVPLDPGLHTLGAQAPGKKSWAGSVTIAAQPGVQAVEVPVLEDAPVAVAPPLQAVTSDEDARRAERAKVMRIGAAVAGGVGVVGVVVGSIFGLRAISKNSDSNGAGGCDSSNLCNNPAGPTDRSDAQSAAAISTVAYVVGVAGLAGGAALWFLAPKPESAASTGSAFTRPRLGVAPAPGGTGLSLVGAF